MIPLEKLKAARVVIGHAREEGGPCPDALAAALIVRDVLPNVEVRFVANESRERAELRVEPGMIFLDIAPPSKRVAAFMSGGAIVLDHHATAKDDVALFRDLGVYSDEPGVSAATLAYRHVWQPLKIAEWGSESGMYWATRHEEVERFARLVGVRDTFQTNDPDWTKACDQTASLTFVPAEEWLSRSGVLLEIGAANRERDDRPDDRQADTLADWMRIGSLLRRRSAADSRAMVEGGFRFTTEKGTRVLVCAGTAVSDVVVSEVDVDVVVGFAFRVRGGAPAMKLSFRSRGFPVRPIAEALGGGGHDRAASAWTDLHASHRHPYAVVRTIMETW